MSDPSRWERLFADLTGEAEQAERAERAAEVVDRTRTEVARLRLVDRLRGAIDQPVSIELPGTGPIRGLLREVGPDWLLLTEPTGEALVVLAHVLSVGGLVAASAAPGSEGRVAARLDLRYVLRRLSRDRAGVVLTRADGSVTVGTLDRVGADFVELAEHPVGEPRRAGAVRQVRTLPLAAVALVRSG